MAQRAQEGRGRPPAGRQRGRSRRASWSGWRRAFLRAEAAEPRSFRSWPRSVLLPRRESLFIGTLRPRTAMVAREDEWNFHGRHDVMVPMRKLELTESEELLVASCHQRDVITEEEEGGGGEKWAVPQGEVVHQRQWPDWGQRCSRKGRMTRSHLLEGLVDKNHAALGSWHLQGTGGFILFFPGRP